MKYTGIHGGVFLVTLCEHFRTYGEIDHVGNHLWYIWGVPKMVGFPNKPIGFSLLKMISTWGVLGVPPFKETPIRVFLEHSSISSSFFLCSPPKIGEDEPFSL